MSTVGVIERRNPLPVGRYWVDVIGDTNRAAFTQWAGGTAGVFTEKVEPQSLDLPGAATTGDFVIFQIRKPGITWPKAGQLGFVAPWGLPNVATRAVVTSTDTAQRPPVPKPMDEIDALGDLLKHGLASDGGRLLLIGLLWWAASKAD